MKRVVIVLALSLMLLVPSWNQAIADDIYDDGDPGDDHPWGSEVPSEDPGQFRHTGDNIFYSGITTIDIVLNSTGILEELESLFSKPIKKTPRDKVERDYYIDRARQQSLD